VSERGWGEREKKSLYRGGEDDARMEVEMKVRSGRAPPSPLENRKRGNKKSYY